MTRKVRVSRGEPYHFMAPTAFIYASTDALTVATQTSARLTDSDTTVRKHFRRSLDRSLTVVNHPDQLCGRPTRWIKVMRGQPLSNTSRLDKLPPGYVLYSGPRFAARFDSPPLIENLLMGITIYRELRRGHTSTKL